MKVLIKPVVLDMEEEDQDVVAYCDNSCGVYICLTKACATNSCTIFVNDEEVDDILF